MISDNIKNASKYYSLGEDFKKAFEFLSKLTPDIKAGGYEVSENVSVNVFSPNTRPRTEGILESHNVNVDIHYVIKGAETVDVCDAEKLAITEDKLEKSDYCFLADAEKYSSVYLSEGDFLVAFPKEAHKPLVASNDAPTQIFKAVAKIKLN